MRRRKQAHCHHSIQKSFNSKFFLFRQYTCLTPLNDKAGVVSWGTCKDCLLRPQSIMPASFILRLEICELLVAALPTLALTAAFFVGDGEREQPDSYCTTFCDKFFTTNCGGIISRMPCPVTAMYAIMRAYVPPPSAPAPKASQLADSAFLSPVFSRASILLLTSQPARRSASLLSLEGCRFLIY